MTRDTEVIDRHGRRVRRSGTLEDGDTIRVTMTLMDGANPDALQAARILQDATAVAEAQKRIAAFDAKAGVGHRPGFIVDVALQDASEKAREARDSRLVNAWRDPPRIVDQQTAKPPSSPSNNTPSHDELIAARDRRISEAWRS